MISKLVMLRVYKLKKWVTIDRGSKVKQVVQESPEVICLSNRHTHLNIVAKKAAAARFVALHTVGSDEQHGDSATRDKTT